MRRCILTVSLAVTIALVFAAAPAGADSVKLKNGATVEGKYLGGTDAKIDFLVAGRVQSYNVAEVQSLAFENKADGESAASSQPTADGASIPARLAPFAPVVPVKTEQVPSASTVTIPAGTTLVVRMIDGVNSDVNKIGDRFNASLESDLTVNGTVIAPKGADVYGRLIEAKQAGRISGQSELRLELTGIKIDAQIVPLLTGAYTTTGSSRTRNSAEKIGGGALLGALIGGIAGGGKGAAVGAGVGAGAGTVVQVVTHGQEVHVPSETVLNFTLEQPAMVPAPTS